MNWTPVLISVNHKLSCKMGHLVGDIMGMQKVSWDMYNIYIYTVYIHMIIEPTRWVLQWFGLDISISNTDERQLPIKSWPLTSSYIHPLRPLCFTPRFGRCGLSVVLKEMSWHSMRAKTHNSECSEISEQFGAPTAELAGCLTYFFLLSLPCS